MPKQTKEQKETVERALHEFKEGELETGTGKRVTSRRQAVAIGLSESGASNQQSPRENEKRRRQAKSRERAEGSTKAELYERAKKRDLPGRSRMSKAELARAVS